jgi:hypothetical protein
MPASPANAREQVIELLKEDQRSGGSASRASRGR